MSASTQQQHNPHWLMCQYGCNRWFKSTGGHTKHNHIFHCKELEAPVAIQRPVDSEQLIHLTLTRFLILKSDEEIQSSSTPNDADIESHNDNPFLNDNPLFNDDPPFNDNSLFNDNNPPFIEEDPLFNDENPEDNQLINDNQACDESPSQDEIIHHHHPLINSTYTLIISVLVCLS